ncbi:hypothetical protein R1flu_018616 [Riccia fluitans]|uniref:Uncharacterized protein n=1 Tax=Riccia fluitans TaxID=41844 RepID=A0ABD1ZGD2_9MARC
MGAESMRIMKDLLRFENSTFRISRERRSPGKPKRGGLRSVFVPKIDTHPRRRLRRPKPKQEELEKEWKNAFVHVDPPSTAPPPVATVLAKEEIPSTRTDRLSTSSSSSPSKSRDNRQSISISPSPPLSSWCENHEELGGWRGTGRQPGRWKGVAGEAGGSRWRLGMCSESQRAMNHKILEAGWVSTFDPNEH